MDLENSGSPEVSFDFSADPNPTTTSDETNSQAVAGEPTAPETTPETTTAPVTDSGTGGNEILAELESLRRVIASDSNLRARYYEDKYGIPYQEPQAPQPPVVPQAQPTVQPQPQPQSVEPLSFSLEDYDPTDANSMIGLFGHVAQQILLPEIDRKLSPALEYVNRLQQQETQEAQREQQQYIGQLEQSIGDLIAKEVPVFGELAKATGPSLERDALMNTTQSLWQQTMMALHPPNERRPDGSVINRLWFHPKAHQEVVAKIAPQVKQLASRLGLNPQSPASQPSPVNRDMARETYVESSNAVPSNTGNAFSEAFEKGDMTSAFRALGYV